MVIDFHTHIFPETMCGFREKFFDGEGAFRLLYDSPKSRMVGAGELIQAMDRDGVDLSVVFGFPWKNGEWAKMNNDYILEAVHAHPDRLKGFACFDLEWDGAAKEAERCLSQGLSGVGELAFYLSGIDEEALDRLEPIMEVCRSHGNLPVMIHTNEPVGHLYPGKTPVTLEQIYALAKRFPLNSIVLAHWGGGIFLYHLMKKEVKETIANIWYDTAASPFLYDPGIYAAARDAGVLDRVLLGSDHPLLPVSRYLGEISASGLSKEAQQMVTGQNALKFLGLNK